MKKLYYFSSAFVIALIILGMLGGFAVVDMSADRYMPGQFGPMFEITSLRSDGISFSFMGAFYDWPLSRLDILPESLYRYRGLFPPEPAVAGQVAGIVLGLIEEYGPVDYIFANAH